MCEVYISRTNYMLASMHMYLSTHGSQSQCHLPSFFLPLEVQRKEEREREREEEKEKRKQSLERLIDAPCV